MPSNMDQPIKRKPRQKSDKPTLIQKARLVIFANNSVNQIKNMKAVSWKTTLGGILAAAGQFVPQFLPPSWHWLSPALTGIGALIIGASARDNGVSSEQAGAK